MPRRAPPLLPACSLLCPVGAKTARRCRINVPYKMPLSTGGSGPHLMRRSSGPSASATFSTRKVSRPNPTVFFQSFTSYFSITVTAFGPFRSISQSSAAYIFAPSLPHVWKKAIIYLALASPGGDRTPNVFFMCIGGGIKKML